MHPRRGVCLLESVTTAPPEGAAHFNVTVPVEEFPPVTLVGQRNRGKITDGRGSRRQFKVQHCRIGIVQRTATNFEAETI